MRISNNPFLGNLAHPRIRQIDARRPAIWLARGWQDLRFNPLPSLAYGLLFALCGDLIILSLIDTPHLLTVAISGFFLLAPLLAAGLYELSRARAEGRKLLFIESAYVFHRKIESLALLGLILALISLFWERFSAVAFAISGAADAAGAGIYLHELLFAGGHLPLTLTWLFLGAALAGFVFAISVVAVPMIVDRGVDPVTAMATSLRACTINPWPLLLWAGLIVLLTLAGFATLLFGLVFLMPILGHASWHAYRDLVE